MRRAFPIDWMVPDWPAPAHVKAVCTTRQGGASQAPWDSLNLGSHVGDNPLHVAANRAQVQAALGVPAVFMNQVHGCAVLQLPQAPALHEATHATPLAASADACLTRTHGLACSILVADCLPVLLTNRQGQWVAAAHAGWRGLAGVPMAGPQSAGTPAASTPGGVLAQIVNAANTNEMTSEIMAWLGPCIGPQAFEVGAEVRAAFVADNPAASVFFAPASSGSSNKWLADLAGLARLRLQSLGVTRIYGNDSSAPWCTVANTSRFFSHRRDGVRLGASGRQGAFIWLE